MNTKIVRNIFASVGLVCLLIGAYALFVSTKKNTSFRQQITQVPFPAQVDFAGERVPLHDIEVKERLDRELTSIALRHGSSSRILKLANRWMPVIIPILRQYGVPEDFKYLAVAESALENAISPKQAKGFWQFLEGTAKSYGLEVSGDVDERYHVEKATAAACQYFIKAHQRFGTWSMAAAAYNMGIGGVGKQASNQQTNNYFDLYLNSETSRYVFRILAYKILMQQPQTYGFYLNQHDLYPTIGYRAVEVTQIPNIATFARSYGTNYKQLKVLNPWLRRTSLRAKGGKKYTIKLPM